MGVESVIELKLNIVLLSWGGVGYDEKRGYWP